jgi:SAM-dependent methyltransferase
LGLLFSRGAVDNLEMKISQWEQRYRSGDRSREDLEPAPNPLLAQTAAARKPGKALDLGCGAGRNSIWLAEQGWQVTAVDGSAAAIEILRKHAAERGVNVEAQVADLEKGEYRVQPESWDLIAMCYYWQISLLDPAKQGMLPGGLVLVIAHIAPPGEEPTEHQLRPGELETHFSGWEILHSYEGAPRDPAHQRLSAEIAARRPKPSP